jgi:hypothetical protein
LLPTATGTATLSFNSPGTYRSLSAQVDGVDRSDGSVLTVTFYDDGKVIIPSSIHYESILRVPQTTGVMTFLVGSASLSVPNGNLNVPLFGKNCGLQGTATDAFGNSYLVSSGSYTALGGP